VKKFLFFLITIWLGFAIPASCQTVFLEEWQAWFRYYNQTQLNEKWMVHAELDERMHTNPWSQSQFFVHLHLHYRIKPWLDVAAGMNYNITTFTAGMHSLNIPEWRPWQEVSVIKNFGKDFLFQFRYRLDERFIHLNDRQVLLDGYRFNWRHRFRIQFSKPIAEFSNQRTLIAKVSDEVMLNSGDVARTFDQNRAFGSLEFNINKKWSLETGYLYLIQQIADNTFSERHIIRTTLYHRIRL
jgi:Protein of unknown function (DUF2490)